MLMRFSQRAEKEFENGKENNSGTNIKRKSENKPELIRNKKNKKQKKQPEILLNFL